MLNKLNSLQRKKKIIKESISEIIKIVTKESTNKSKIWCFKKNVKINKLLAKL